jgi:hypothetical protein
MAYRFSSGDGGLTQWAEWHQRDVDFSLTVLDESLGEFMPF